MGGWNQGAWRHKSLMSLLRNETSWSGTLCSRRQGTLPGGRAYSASSGSGRLVPGPCLPGPIAALGARCRQHSYLWWHEKGVPTLWVCSPRPQQSGPVRLTDRAFPSQGPAAPDQHFSGANTPNPWPSLSVSNKQRSPVTAGIPSLSVRLAVTS